MTLTPAQFTSAVARTRMQSEATIQACRLVLVEGLTIYAAAKKTGRAQSVVNRAVARLTADRKPKAATPAAPIAPAPEEPDARLTNCIAALRKVEKMLAEFEGEPADSIRRVAKQAADEAEA